MKKFYTIILVAFMAITSAFADDLQPLDCEITVSDIKAYSATVTITPKDNSTYFIYSCCTKEKYSEMGETGLKDYFKEQMDYYIEYYEEMGEELSYGDFAYTGQISKNYESLAPETSYVVFAYSINPFNGTSTSSLKTAEFTTPEDSGEVEEEIDMHIVNPKWNDQVAGGGWWQISGYTEDKSHWVTLSNISTTQVSGTYYEEDLDMNYTKLYYYDDNGNAVPVACKYVEVAINLDDNGIVTAKAEYITPSGVWYHITFDDVDTSEIDGIQSVNDDDNINANISKKYIRNHHLVIENDGLLFNAAGQSLSK